MSDHAMLMGLFWWQVFAVFCAIVSAVVNVIREHRKAALRAQLSEMLRKEKLQ